MLTHAAAAERETLIAELRATAEKSDPTGDIEGLHSSRDDFALRLLRLYDPEAADLAEKAEEDAGGFWYA